MPPFPCVVEDDFIIGILPENARWEKKSCAQMPVKKWNSKSDIWRFCAGAADAYAAPVLVRAEIACYNQGGKILIAPVAQRVSTIRTLAR